MQLRGLVLSTLLVVSLAARDASGQDVPDDGVRRLLDRLEQSIERNDVIGFEALLTASADRVRTAGFVETEMLPGVTRVAIHERARAPLDDSLPGHGFSVAVSVFEEYGDRARIAAWSFDVKKRPGESGIDGEWLIADQVRLGSVEDLFRLSLNPARQYTATGLRLVDEDLSLTLTDGTVFVSDIDQGTTAVVLLGSGDMTFRPAPEREKSQARIFSGTDTIDSRFDAVYLRIHPGDFARLLSSRQLVAAPVERAELRKAERVFREHSPKSYSLGLGDVSSDNWSLVPDPGNLVAEIQTRRFGTLTYTRSSSLRDDISLVDRRRGKTIALYSSALQDRVGLATGESDAAFDVRHYDIAVSVEPDRQWIDGRASLTIRVGRNAVHSLSLRLAEPLAVQSIVSDKHGQVLGLRATNQGAVVVNFPTALAGGSELTLTIAYAGRLEPQEVDVEAMAQFDRPQFDAVEPLEQPEPSFLFSNQVNWYPRPTTSHYATATLRVTVPAALDCVASGTLEPDSPLPVPSAVSEPARKTYTFNARQPLRYFAFIVSRLEQAERVDVRFPSGAAPPTVPSDASVRRSLDLSVIASPGHRSRIRATGERAAGIARFYQSLVGDVPYPSLTLALIENSWPGGHSPGYFAVINQPPLPTGFSRWRGDPASFPRFPDFFLAHEIAHQWWGQAVGWRSYQEQWLSEAFAQYFAALYAAQAAPDGLAGEALFRELLRQMHRWALDKTDQGPISLGSRLGHLQDDGRIFRAVVYNKGALVLHMLRQLVGDDVFFRGLRRFYGESRFRSVGTADFRAAMEAEADRSLDRFFERWIYGWTVPRLLFRYHVEAREVVLTIEQVGDDVFDLPVTVTLQYADGTSADVLVPVTARVVSWRVPAEGVIRSAVISTDEPPLADIVRN